MIQTPQLSISKRGLFSSLGILASALLFSGCQDEDYGYTSEQIAYRTNFEKMYGKIDPDQIWDFSTYNLGKLGLTGGPSEGAVSGKTLTRAADGMVQKYNSSDVWYDVSPQTTAWLNNNLEEKRDNRQFVSPFEWTKGSSDFFYIIPIYQGQSGMIWNLELIDIGIGTEKTNTSTIIWSKSENLQYTEDFSRWEEFFYESYNSSEAPNSPRSLTNEEGQRISKFDVLKYSNPFHALTQEMYNSWYNSWENDYENNKTIKDIYTAYSVSRDTKGFFYLTINGEDVKLTKSNTNSEIGVNEQPSFWEVNKYFITVDDTDENIDGLFTFKIIDNVKISENRTLQHPKTSSPNRIKWDNLLGTTINGEKITIDILKTLKFVITNNISDSAYEGIDYDFNTWSPERIHVYTKYGYTGSTVLLSSISINNQNSYIQHHTINKNNVQTRPIRIDATKLEGTSFAFNLKTIKRGDGDRDLSDIGDDHRSDQNFMSQISYFSADNSPITKSSLISEFAKFGINDLNDDFEYRVIGCEDAGYNGKNTDADFNDVVFLLVANVLPDQMVKKRYMIEDLGSTLDFDFNDIVVDVTETVARMDNGKKEYRQVASIKHLQGTIPFRVTIGNMKFGKGDEYGKIMRGHNKGDITYDPSDPSDNTNYAQYSWEYSVEISNSDETALANFRRNYWDPDKNNITIEVWPDYMSENNDLTDVFWEDGKDNNMADNISASDKTNNVQTRKIVEFPQNGKIPYIIATDQTVGWMEETNSIPENWIQTRPQNFNNNFPQTPSTEENNNADSGQTGPSTLTNPSRIDAGYTKLSTTPTTILNWKNAVIIPSSEFNNVYNDDVIIVNVAGVQNNSQLGFMKNSTDAESNEYNEAVSDNLGVNGKFVVTGDLAINLTQDIVNTLKTSGLAITGQNITVTSVSIQNSRGNSNPLATSAFVLKDQRAVMTYFNNQISIPKSELDKLYVGDKIVIHMDNLRNNSQIGFKNPSDGWSNRTITGVTANAYGNFNVTGDYVLEVTASNINQIKAGNLGINGQHVTITSVDVQTKDNGNLVSNPNKISGATSIYDQRQVINYYNHFDIAKDGFSNLEIGDQVIIHVDNIRTNSALGLRTTSNGSITEYGSVDGGNKYYGQFNGDYALTITSEETLNELKTNGLRITGAYINVTGVDVSYPTITVSCNISPSNDAGSVKITDTKTSNSGTNTLKVHAGEVSISAQPVSNSGYRFYVWGGSGVYDNPRTINWGNQNENRSFYASFAKQLQKEDSGWGLIDGYEYLKYDGNNTSDLSDLVVNSQLVFFFDEDASGTFDAAKFTIHHKSGEHGDGDNAYTADKFDDADVEVNKISSQKLVIVTLKTQEAVDYIKSNGFKLRVTNMGSGKTIYFRFSGIGKK